MHSVPKRERSQRTPKGSSYISQSDRIRLAYEAAQFGANVYVLATILGIEDMSRAAEIAGIEVVPCLVEGVGRG